MAYNKSHLKTYTVQCDIVRLILELCAPAGKLGDVVSCEYTEVDKVRVCVRECGAVLP